MLEQIQNILSESLISSESMAIVIESEIISIQSITCYCIISSWSGFNGVGTETITVSASNDGEVFIPINSFIPTGTTGGNLLNVEKAGYRHIKVTYTPGIGSSGALSVTISGKVI